MQAYRLGAGFKLAQFMHQSFKTHRSLTEPRLNAIISELLEQGVAVDMLERAPSAPPAPTASTSAAASSAALPPQLPPRLLHLLLKLLGRRRCQTRMMTLDSKSTGLCATCVPSTGS